MVLAIFVGDFVITEMIPVVDNKLPNFIPEALCLFCEVLSQFSKTTKVTYIDEAAYIIHDHNEHRRGGMLY